MASKKFATDVKRLMDVANLMENNKEKLCEI